MSSPSTFTQQLRGKRWYSKGVCQPGDVLYIPLSSDKASWTVFAYNASTVAGAATLEAVLSDSNGIRIPLGISGDGTLAAGQAGSVGQQNPIAGILVSVANTANAPTTVEVLQ